MTIPAWFDIQKYTALLDDSATSELALYFQFKARFDIYSALYNARRHRGDTPYSIHNYLPKGIKAYWGQIRENGLITPVQVLDCDETEGWLEKHNEPTHPIDLVSLHHLRLLTEDIEKRMTEENLEIPIETPVHSLYEHEKNGWVYFRADLDLPTRLLIESFENHVKRIKKSTNSVKDDSSIKNPDDKIRKIRKYQLIPYLDIHLANQIEGENSDLDLELLASTLSTEDSTFVPRDFKSGPKSKVGYLAKAVLDGRFLKNWRATIEKRHFKEKTIPEISLTTWPR